MDVVLTNSKAEYYSPTPFKIWSLSMDRLIDMCLINDENCYTLYISHVLQFIHEDDQIKAKHALQEHQLKVLCGSDEDVQWITKSIG